MFKKTWAKVVAIATIITIVAGLITICDKLSENTEQSSESVISKDSESLVTEESTETNVNSNNSENEIIEQEEKSFINLQTLDYLATDWVEVYQKPIKLNTGDSLSSYYYLDTFDEGIITYMLDGSYKRITGTAGIRFDMRDYSGWLSPDRHYFVILADGEPIYSQGFEATTLPYEFDLNIEGVTKLEIKFVQNSGWKGYIVIGDMYLWKNEETIDHYTDTKDTSNMNVQKEYLSLQSLDYLATDWVEVYQKPIKLNTGDSLSSYYYLDTSDEGIITYMIDGSYKRITGTAGIRFDMRDYSEWLSPDRHYFVILADGEPIYSQGFEATTLPYEFDLNIEGVTKLEIKFVQNSGWKGYIVIGDIVLWT